MLSSGSSSLSKGSSHIQQCVALFFPNFYDLRCRKETVFCVHLCPLLTNAAFEQNCPYNLLSCPHDENREHSNDDQQLPKQTHMACAFQSRVLIIGQLLHHIQQWIGETIQSQNK